MPRKKQKAELDGNFVLFGFHESGATGYIEKSGLDCTDDIHQARVFQSKKPRRAKGFGTPQQWCDFYNTEKTGWKFHLVKTCLEPDLP